MLTTKSFGVLLVFIGLLSGCGEDIKPKDQAAANPVADSLAPRYEASLAEGIDFKKPGYPSFLAEVSGISAVEGWGRWTDGPVAKFRFKQPFPSKFTLLVSAGASSSNIGKQAIVRVGKIEKRFTVKEPTPTEYSLNFEGVDSIDTLEIIPSNHDRAVDVDPKNPDTRSLGLAMIYLKIQ